MRLLVLDVLVGFLLRVLLLLGWLLLGVELMLVGLACLWYLWLFWVVAVIVILVFCELWFKLLGLGWLIVLGWCTG